jgi:hypothetical protein
VSEEEMREALARAHEMGEARQFAN